MTHILQVTEDHSLSNTGITSAVDALMRQVQPTLQQTLLSTGSETVPLPTNVPGIQLPIDHPGRIWRAAPKAAQALANCVRQVDGLHLHGIWMWVQWAAARAARQQHKPFAISTHGMLEPWIWQRQRWPHRLKKYLYWRLVAYPAFQAASVIHAIHSREALNLRAYFPNVPVEIIPLSIDLEAIDRSITTDPKPLRDPYILFMGRIHPVKGIDLLIQAFARLDAPHMSLKIAGPVQQREAEYAAHLQALVKKNGLSERVEFLGAVHGEQKWALYRNAWVFCLPSYSEGIGMVNLEAAACRTPVITSYATGILDAWADRGGYLIKPGVEPLAEALALALGWALPERIERGNDLRQLIEESYSWNATAKHWIALYQRLAVKP